MKNKNELLIYQWKNGEILLKEDVKSETIWANQKQIADIFWVQPQAITKHIINIYNIWELSENQTCSILEQVNLEWRKTVKRKKKFYNLDMIISIWYRINSIKATEFRKWATNILKEHISKGFTINKKQIQNNYDNFLKAVENIKKLSLWKNIWNDEILNLISSFANTRFNLDNFDKWRFPEKWFTKIKFNIEINKLYEDVNVFKNDLIKKWLATKLFAQEINTWNLSWIFWNIFASFDWKDMYETIEEKASNLLYLIIKNHPFSDWNKRTWAFCFIWFLKKINYDFQNIITPETLTTLTLLIAESNPKDKSRMIWLILLFFKR